MKDETKFNILELVIPFVPLVSIKLWKKLCLKKHELAHKLGIY